MVPIKNKNKRLWRKNIKHSYGSWSLKSEKVQGRKVLAMRIISLESLYSGL